MAHPYAKYSEHRAGRRKAHEMLKGHARGGKSDHSDEAEDRALFNKMFKEKMHKDGSAHGEKSKARLDKAPRHATGGSTTSKSDSPKPIKPEKDTDWMKGLSEKDIATTLGSTHRDSSGMRGHKKGGRVDKYARGGKAKGKKGHHTHINIVVAPKGGDAATLPTGPMGGAAPPVPKGPMAPPPGGPAAGGPLGAGGPPGMPPGMMNKGGRVRGQKGGADSGVGRLDKVKMYGKRAKGK